MTNVKTVVMMAAVAAAWGGVAAADELIEGSEPLPEEVLAVAQGVSSVFNPLVPCRLVDTRLVGGPFGNGTTRSFSAWPESVDLSSQGGNAGGCGIPANATALHVNMTAVAPAGAGYLRTWAWSDSEPGATVFAWDSGFGYSNAATVPICSESTIISGVCDADYDVKIYGAPTELVMDVFGYYAPPEPATPAATDIYYRPVRPCRLADTRVAGGAFGNATEREFKAMPESVDLSAFGGNPAGCNIPSDAVAVHVNFTLVGPGVSGYLRSWAAGGGEPNATLVAWKAGFGTTNAVTIPVCTGGACVNDFVAKIYSSAPVDMVIDVFGYQAP